jgi:hypothetical protein
VSNLHVCCCSVPITESAIGARFSMVRLYLRTERPSLEGQRYFPDQIQIQGPRRKEDSSNDPTEQVNQRSKLSD